MSNDTRLYLFKHGTTGEEMISEGSRDTTALAFAQRDEWESQGVAGNFDLLRVQKNKGRIHLQTDVSESEPEKAGGTISEDDIPQ